MQDFASLLAKYGWHLALVGLIGTIMVGLLKKPLNAIISKKFPPETNPISDQKFDVIAFILGFIVAVILSIVYTIIADKCFPDVLGPTGEVATFGAMTYITNILGAWTFQILYYQVWKKAGLKAVIQIILQAIKNSAVKMVDRDGDGKVSVGEAAQTIQGIVKEGKLNIAEILSAAEKAAPGIIDEIVSNVNKEAGDAAKVSTEKSIEQLASSLKDVASVIPNDKIVSVADAVVDAAAEKAQSIAKETAKPVQRPIIKF